jgi:hypothetical protein
MGMPDHVTFKKALAQYDALNTEGDVSRLRDIVSILKEISEFERWWNRDLPRKENPDMYLKMCLSEADALAIVSGSVSAWEEEDDAYLTRVRENLRNYSRHAQARGVTEDKRVTGAARHQTYHEVSSSQPFECCVL